MADQGFPGNSWNLVFSPRPNAQTDENHGLQTDDRKVKGSAGTKTITNYFQETVIKREQN